VSHATLPSRQLDPELALIDGIIALIERASAARLPTEQAALLLEHLRSASAYLRGGMPNEYSAVLEAAEEVASRIKDRHLRRELKKVFEILSGDLASNDTARGPEAHHIHQKRHGQKPPGATSPLWDFFSPENVAFGIFYPKHHIIATFRSFDSAQQAQGALRQVGFDYEEVRAVPGRDMLEFLDEVSRYSGVFGALMARLSRGFGTEEVFVDEDIQRAREGAGFLAIYCPAEEDVQRVRDLVLPFGPISMQRYLATGIQSLI
jgi:hypothetical protein